MPELNPLNRQTLDLYKEFKPGDTEFLTVGKFKKTSVSDESLNGIIGAQIIAFSPHTELVEGGYINIVADPELFEDRSVDGEENIYRYQLELDINSKPFRGIDSDNQQIPPTKYKPSLENTHPEGSTVAIVSSSEFFKQMENKFDLAQKAAKKKVRAEDVRIARGMVSLEERVKYGVKNFIQKIRTEFSNFRTRISQENSAFQEKISTDLSAAIDEGRLIVAKINSSDASKIDISSGNWLDGITERLYNGITALSVTLNQTTYYQLESGTGNLITSTTGFSGGNFPIAKVVAGVSNVTSITNYGVYQVPTIISDLVGTGYVNPIFLAGKLTSFEESDGTVWNLTYTADGRLKTVSDGTDTTTLNYNAGGELTSIT